jgi:hypothetical protein
VLRRGIEDRTGDDGAVGNVVRQDGSTLRTLRRSLTCPACGVIVAEAVRWGWPRSLLQNVTVTAPEGYVVQPIGVDVQLRLAKQEVANAASARERDDAQTRLAYLRRNAAELVYHLRCRNGHRTLRTMPDIVRAMRKSSGSWVSLQ